jgi:hypothetical protein
MKFWIHLLWVSNIFVTCFCCALHAQGTFNRTIRFEGPPVVPPGTGVAITNYYEDSMTFTPMNPGEQFSRAGGGRAEFPENGSAYILQAAIYSLSGSRGGVSRFGLYSVDLAEFSTLYAFPAVVQFVGYRSDGGIVTTEFATDGIIDGTGPLPDFQTFYFGAEFSNLVRFEAPSHTYALDNLVFFDVIPEPGTWALLFVGGMLIGCRCLKRNRRHQRLHN